MELSVADSAIMWKITQNIESFYATENTRICKGDCGFPVLILIGGGVFDVAYCRKTVTAGLEVSAGSNAQRTDYNANVINNLSLRGALRRSNLVKYEIATPFGLAMTMGTLKY